MNCARHCARPAVPARPSARPMCWPAWAWRSSSRAGRRPGWPPSRLPYDRSSGVLAARVRLRRAVVFFRLGRYPEALEDVRHAVGVLRRAGDTLWTARALNTRASAYLRLGSTSRADADYVSAAQAVLHHRAGAGSALPGGQSRADRLRVRRPPGRAGPSRCGGPQLPAAERADHQAALRTVCRATGGRAGRRCPGRGRGRVAGNRGDPRPAHAEGGPAADGGQLRAGRDAAPGCPGLGAGRAPHVPVTAKRLAAGPCGGRSRPGPIRGRPGSRPRCCARRTGPPPGWMPLARATRPRRTCWPGALPWTLGRRDDAERHLAALARTRRRGPALSRVSGWLGEALRAEAAGRPSRMLTACRRGLDVLDEHRLALGASELRAQATVHGAELAALAQRHAAQARRPRLLLTWSERWRATAWAVPPVRPSADAELNASLAALRSCDQGPGRGTEPRHAERVAAERTTAAGNRGARQRAASPG